MKYSRLGILMIAIMTTVLWGNVLSKHAINEDPSAQDVYSAMIETIKKAESLYIECTCLTEYKEEEIPKSTYRLWLKKPSFARMERMLEDGVVRGVLIGDGNTFWIHYPPGRPYYGFEDSTAWSNTHMTSYMRFPIPAEYFSIAHKAVYLGNYANMTILQPSIFHGAPDGLENLINDIVLIGDEKVNDEPCTIIEISYMDGQRKRKIWISRNDNLPRKLEQTLKLASNLVNYEEWSTVKVNCDMTDDHFSWAPPDGWTEFRMPNIEDGLLKPGTQAPDFHFQLVNGEEFKLSHHKGKTIIVNFWRAGCPPCRTEIPYLESLHNEYKSKGLIVLGFNCSDDKEVALEFLGKYGASYPNIVDSTGTAMNVYFEKYQTLRGFSSVPLNYLIDSEGKVVQGWYGYGGEADSSFINALRKVGF